MFKKLDWSGLTKIAAQLSLRGDLFQIK